jgi:hypothetical protein
LPLFIDRTWGWGEGVPNYGAGGSFPELPSPPAALQPVVAVVDQIKRIYASHSASGGGTGAAEDEKRRTLEQIADLRQKFWAAVGDYARQEWSWFRRRKELRRLRALRLPNREQDRIVMLGARRDHRSQPAIV